MSIWWIQKIDFYNNEYESFYNNEYKYFEFYCNKHKGVANFFTLNEMWGKTFLFWMKCVTRLVKPFAKRSSLDSH